MKIQELFGDSWYKLSSYEEQGLITSRVHPEFDNLVILNYTDKCVYDRAWDKVTRNSRGLIFDADTGEVVARGLPKFFNHNEPGAPEIGLDEEVIVMDKYDGSLGILYTTPMGDYAIATRGSFASEQAIEGTKMLEGMEFGVRAGETLLFEIIYPENRIVLDYGSERSLRLIGAVSNETGELVRPSSKGVLFKGTYYDFLEQHTDRPNAEGVVIYASGGRAVKMKQDDYIALHRIVSNLTPKEIWRQLREGTYEQYLPSVPDEFYGEVTYIAGNLIADYSFIESSAIQWLEQLKRENQPTRKDQALWIQNNVEPREIHGLMFSLLDDRDISDAIWRMIEPKGTVHDIR